MIKRLALSFVLLCTAGAGALLYVDGHVPASIPEGSAPLDYRPLFAALVHVSSSTGLVDYEALRQDRAGLDQFIEQLARVSPINRPEQFASADERLAFWLNAYHALVLQAALELDRGDRLDGGGRSFYWLRSWPIGGRRFTLWALERRFLRETGDPRVPFALACGARGCALLDGSPYQPDLLSEQLNDAVRRFVQSERQVRLKADGLHLSPLFEQNVEDLKAALPEGRAHWLQFVWAFLPDVCADRPGCDTRSDLDKACGPKLDACAVKYDRFDWELAGR